MICPSCKKEIPDASPFCPNCLVPIKVGDVILPDAIQANYHKEKEPEIDPSIIKDASLRNVAYEKRGTPDFSMNGKKSHNWYLIGGITLGVIILGLIIWVVIALTSNKSAKPEKKPLDPVKIALYKKVSGSWISTDDGRLLDLNNDGVYSQYLNSENYCDGEYDIESGAIDQNGNRVVVDKDQNFIYTITLKPTVCLVNNEKQTEHLPIDEYAITVILPARDQMILRNIDTSLEETYVK